MPNTLYLHIGTHKTATTTVQHFFARNRGRLREAGVFYPPQDLAGVPNHYAHHRISHAIAGRDQLMDFDGAKGFFDAVRKEALEGEAVFISAEPFYRHKVGSGDSRNRASACRAYIARVAEALKDFNVKVMVMLRRQDLFAESLYGEHVLSTSYAKGIHSFLEDKQSLLDYAARLGQWAEAFGQENMMVHTFEAESLDEPVERFFVEWLGLEWHGGFKPAGSMNSSLNGAFVEYKRRINTRGQSKSFNNLLRHALTEVSQRPFARKLLADGAFFLSPAERYGVMERFAAGNREVARRYLGRDALFLRAIEADARRYRGGVGLTGEGFQEITRHLLKLLDRGT